MNTFGLTFALSPQSVGELISTLVILGFLGLAAFLIEQPEWERFTRKYIVSQNDVVEIDGLISKRKIMIPYGSITQVTLKKSFVGRILKYGDLYVSVYSEGGSIHMKGIRNATEIHEIIQNRINMVREGQLTFFGGKPEKKERKEESEEFEEEVEEKKETKKKKKKK
jgi:uncharacterized membrane protein YdbT with pleckstrin-like domain